MNTPVDREYRSSAAAIERAGDGQFFDRFDDNVVARPHDHVRFCRNTIAQQRKRHVATIEHIGDARAEHGAVCLALIGGCGPNHKIDGHQSAQIEIEM